MQIFPDAFPSTSSCLTYQGQHLFLEKADSTNPSNYQLATAPCLEVRCHAQFPLLCEDFNWLGLVAVFCTVTTAMISYDVKPPC